MQSSAAPLEVDYFDGVSTRAHRVSMRIHESMLQLTGPDLFRQVALGKVNWSERTRHGARSAHFVDGGSVQSLDTTHWDSWLKANHLDEPLVVRAQQSWRWTALATCVLLLVAVLGYWWGLPMAARTVMPWIPTTVDESIGRNTLQAMEEKWLKPSQLDAAQQARWQSKLNTAIAKGLARTASGAHAEQPAIKLYFRHAAAIGPNAFALPDGSIVITDELILMLQDREDVIEGVLGHEIGHVQLRHGVRTLLQTALLSVASSLVFGDFSSLLAGAPALMGHLAYSRDMEREADDVAIAFMRINHIRPSAMTIFFQRLKATTQHPESPGIAFSSHPADEERMARFKNADLADLPG